MFLENVGLPLYLITSGISKNESNIWMQNKYETFILDETPTAVPPTTKEPGRYS